MAFDLTKMDLMVLFGGINYQITRFHFMDKAK